MWWRWRLCNEPFAGVVAAMSRTFARDGSLDRVGPAVGALMAHEGIDLDALIDRHC